ncbi:hypothetical protein HX893_30130 [Pseudomonas reactans]|uniref:Uncharacterized protein n=1 Tax=Pseudomonas reactans TaxID=117680 RepID=A0A7Y8G7D4_9PSED|nr:hypothetical protein [Pseudomonas reactans]NWD83643.1 hypothetical protein [Pseudomonas reactans]NWE92388.1 hypothetical protein [Pseudomonas reactans]
METAIHSHNTIPWKPPLASAPFCMETPFDRHKNTAQLVTLFALSNLWMARRHLLTNAGEVRL